MRKKPTMRLSSKQTTHCIISKDLAKLIESLQKDMNTQLKLKGSKKKATFVWASHKLAAKLKLFGGLVR